MSESRVYCVFQLATLLSVSSSGTGIIYVCRKDSVRIFETITVTSNSSYLSLYTNGANYSLIAMWTMKNSTLSTTILPNYVGKIVRDEAGDIWILNVDLSDEANYVLQNDIDNSSTKSEVQVQVMVPPTEDCKPKITRMNNSLNAHLEANVCGKHVGSVRWHDGHGNSFRNETIKLPPGSETSTYYACIDGPAVKCVNTSTQSDYCSNYSIGGIVSKFVCLGSSLQLFEAGNTDFSVYKSGANNALIVMRSTVNSMHILTIPSEFKEKVHLDENGNIWIRNVNHSDEAIYIIYGKNGSFTNSKVQIVVMVAPSEHCKPKIELADNIVYASLEAKDCGKPAASVQLWDVHGNSYKNKTVKLPPGSETSKYYACIDSPALRCVNTLKQPDHCSTYTYGDNKVTSPQTPVISDVITAVIVPIAIVLGITIAVVIVFIILWRKWTTNQHDEVSDSMPNESNETTNENDQVINSMRNRSNATTNEDDEVLNSTPNGSDATTNEHEVLNSMQNGSNGTAKENGQVLNSMPHGYNGCTRNSFMEGCQKTYSSKISLQQNTQKHFQGVVTAAYAANQEIVPLLGKEEWPSTVRHGFEVKPTAGPDYGGEAIKTFPPKGTGGIILYLTGHTDDNSTGTYKAYTTESDE